MSKAETVQAIADTLQKFGWSPAGETRSEIVIVPTSKSPRFGNCGGELREFKGRQRFQLRRCFCTVGPRTVNFYRVENGQAGPLCQARSNDLDRVAWLAEHYEAEPCRDGDGLVSHDFIGDECCRCGKALR